LGNYERRYGNDKPLDGHTRFDEYALKADNPREKLKEITDRLEQGIKELFESDRYKSYLQTLSKFHNYSFNNCLLIAMQKPDATHVAGFASWRDNFKRNVMKGEKCIRILSPSPYKVQKEQDRIDPQSGRPVIGADGKTIKNTVEVTMPSFKVATVFDVSQTAGEPLPEIGVNELIGSVDKYGDFLDALKKSSPVPIEFEDITGGAKGYYDQTERHIAICEGMSEVGKTLQFLADSDMKSHGQVSSGTMDAIAVQGFRAAATIMTMIWW
jgi:hypothetical protein